MYVLVYITCTFPYAMYPSSGQDLLSLPRRRMLPDGSRSGCCLVLMLLGSSLIARLIHVSRSV